MANLTPEEKHSVGVEYKAGIKTVRAIGHQYGISAGRISQIAKSEGWTRDLAEKIRVKAEARVNKEALNKDLKRSRAFCENQIVEANAKLQSDIILAHRVDIPKKRELVAKLFAEVESLTDGSDVVEQMVMALGSNDMEKLAASAQKAISLPSRIKGVADLVNAFKTVVAMERQAFGIDDGRQADEDGSVTVTVKHVYPQ